jgi:hypothetical protein
MESEMKKLPLRPVTSRKRLLSGWTEPIPSIALLSRFKIANLQLRAIGVYVGKIILIFRGYRYLVGP